jgi:hypothetical protein
MADTTAAFAYFKSKGYPDAGAAAIVGRGMVESGLDPTKQHDKDPKTGAFTGLGAFGWRDPPGTTGGRMTALKQFAASSGRSPTDLNTQFDFLDHELNTTEKAVGDRLRAATNVDEATDAMIDFERPAGWSQGNPRGGMGWADGRNYAQQILGGTPAQVDTSAPDMGGAVDGIPASAFPDDTEEEAAPTLRQTLRTALDQDNVVFHVLDDFLGKRPEMQPDPSYMQTPEEVKALMEKYALQPQQASELGGAWSATNAEWVASRIAERNHREDTLGRAGWTGTGARVLATMLDPAALATGMAGGGLAEKAMAAWKLGTVSKIGVHIVAGAADQAAYQTIANIGQPGTDPNAVMYAAAGGAIFGSAFGAWASRSAISQAAADRINVLGQDLRKRALAGTALTPSGLAPGSAGAASAGRMALRDDVALWENLPEATAPHAAFAGILRQDTVGRLKSMADPAFRAIGNVLGLDSVANKDKSITTIFGASEEALILRDKAIGRSAPAYREAYDAWLKDKGIAWYRRPFHSTEFNDAVTRYVTDSNPLNVHDANVAKAGDTLRDGLARWQELKANPGLVDGTTRRAVAGAENVQQNRFYFPRLWDFEKLNQWTDRIGEAGVIGVVRTALKSAQPLLDHEIAHRVASGMYKKLMERDAGLTSRLEHALSGDDADTLTDVLKGLGISEADAEAVAKSFKPDTDAGNMSRNKFRARLDENIPVDVFAQDGTKHSVTVRDFTDNNAWHVYEHYSHEAAGQVALARVQIKNHDTGELLLDGITKRSEFEALQNVARAQGAQNGTKRATTAAGIEHMEHMYRGLLGLPHASDQGNLAAFGRLLQNFNFLRLMNNMGFAQMAEMGNIVSNLGVRAAIEGIPSLTSIVRSAPKGIAKGDKLGRELLETFGDDDLRYAMPTTWEDVDSLTTTTAPWIRNTDQVMRKGAAAVATISLLRPVNRMLKQTTYRGLMYKFAAMARQGVNPKQMDRLRALGLSDEMLPRILDQFKTHTGTAKGLDTRGLGLNSWTDLEARSHFELGVNRWARKIIQENDLGAMPTWLQHRGIKVALQFRTFMVGSYFKQTLHNVHMRDATSYATFMATAFTAAAAFTARTRIAAMGYAEGKDRDQYWKDKVSGNGYSNLGFNTFQNMGMASVIPMLLDGAAYYGSGMKAHIFNGRSTGMQSDPIFGNPTMDLGV